MAFLYIYGFLFTFVSCALAVKDTCVKTSSCVCLFPNGTGIDLSPAVSTSFYSAQIYDVKMNGSQYEMITYYYHPCYDVKINVTDQQAQSTCTDPLSICRHVDTMKLANATAKTFVMDNGTYDFMGKTNNSKFSDEGDSIIYSNGPSDTIVLLQCAQTENQLQVYSIMEPNKIVLAFYSRDACLKLLEEGGRSFGSTLLIIFFSFLIFYLVLGICTKKFLMGATGIEVIPNLGFWSELPNLVKDGWLFMSNGFKLPPRASGQTVSPDPNSYDSI
ncbi:uncharacterized protein LOC142977271 [Anticarsia gemmatalis]|uniref:uncharacterized protein LOC142977271 n=1 Tax=Anticarsia gemmatalis TaxID=129554 RepID=UPI003F75886A